MEKKMKTIYGTLNAPLVIGEPAHIKLGDKIMVTSPVEHFATNPSGVIYIQTRRTHYYLHPPVR